jgi:hypothetical protein
MFQKNSTKLMLSAMGALLLASTTPTTQAQIVAYEGFDYAAGTQLNGLNGGTGGAGWGTTWSATSAAIATNSATGLTFGSLPTTGGSVVLGNPTGSTGPTASSQRLLNGTLTSIVGGAGTVWVSLLYQNWSTDNGGLSGFREAKLALFSGATANANGTANVNGTERLDIGTPNTYAAGASDTLTLWQGSTFASSGIATARGNNPANTAFLLLRLDFDATTANDTAYAWFNTGVDSEPSTGTAVTFTAQDLTSINALRLQAGNLNASGTNAVWAADELHVGRSWADVVTVPEPSTWAMLGLGGLALLARRFRKN